MKINMSVWITENSNILSYDDVVAKERNKESHWES